MGRPTKWDRREDYLRIGAGLVATAASSQRTGAALALAHVRIADVAERAGVTKGALYHLWPTQTAYWEDLLDHLLATQGLLGSTPAAEALDRLELDLDRIDLVHGWANAVFDRLSVDPSFYLRIALVPYVSDPAERRRLDAHFRAALAEFVPVVDAVLADLGRRWRPGLDGGTYLVAVIAALQGLGLHSRTAPDGAPEFTDDQGRRVTLFAVAVEGLMQACSEPVDPTVPARPRIVARRPRATARAEAGLRGAPAPSGAPTPEAAPADAAPHTGRPTSEERRLDYLQVGAEIVTGFAGVGGQNGIDALVNIRIADVAERAGVTKGALYHVWPDQSSFRVDLLQHLLDVDESAGVLEADALIDDLITGLDGADPAATAPLVVQLGDFVFDRLRGDPVHAARWAFATHLDHPEVAAPLARSARTHVHHYQGFLDVTGRRMRAPFVIDDLAAVGNALVEGLLLRDRTSPELADATIDRPHPADRPPGGSGEPAHRGPWRLPAWSLFTEIMWLTEPAD